ncbi:MAG: hypothetical protein ACR2QT_02115 [Woeseiaceae bacterium]
MHAESIMRRIRILTFIIPALALAGCGQGDGPDSITGTPATPLPDIPPGFCDAINFEILCPPPMLSSFASAVTEIIDNPDASGINDSDKVAQFQKFPNPTEFFGGTRFDLAAPVDFATGQAFTVKVWSTRAVPLTFKLEETNDGTLGVEGVRGHSGSGMWEELCYDFSGATLTVIAYTLIFDNGVQGFADVDPDNWTFFYDDITQVASCPGAVDTMLPVDFEEEAFNYDFNNFEGGVASVITNPDQSGINTSPQVARMQKFAATSGLTFGGATLAIDVPANVVAGSSFTMKVWSQRPVPVLLQPEPQGPGSGTEVTHNGTGWEELTFSLPALAGTVDGLTVIFDINVLGDTDNNPNDWTFYFDDITLVPPGGGGGNEPTVAASTPTQDPANVISLFSDAYTDVTVDTFLAGFSAATLEDVQVAGNPTKKYSSLDFAGIEFVGANAIDASGMTHVHMDIWTPDATDFAFKFVDFGGDGFGGGNDTENVPVSINAGSTPPLTQGAWVSVDVALADLQAAGLTNLTDLNQLVIIGQPSGAATVFIDNLYFYNDAGGGGGNEPTAAAPTPMQDPANVISLFSDAYTDVTVDTFLAGFSAATLEDVMVAGDNVKKYSSLDFAGIEFVGANAIDASGMTHVHMDIWTPDATDFAFKFVDFGGDGFGGGNDTENVPVSINAGSTPPLTQGNWISVDIALTDLQTAGLANLTDLNQLIIIGQPPGAATVFVDNLYFYNDTGGGGGNEPTVAAPTPMQDPGDVISLFSNAYGDVTVDTFLAGFSAATLEDVLVDGNDTKKYSSLDFAGIEFVGANAIDASGMTHIHMDIWSPDATDFAFKFVDFGGDGFGGGNDTENVPVSFNAGSTPPLNQGEWISIDVALADLQAAGLASLTDLNQLIIVGQPPGAATVFIDNLYFYDDNAGGGGGVPAMSAPTPTQNQADVMSLYSDSYTDAAVTWPTPWSVPNDTTSDVMLGGELVKEHLNVSFIGVEFPTMDISGMTHLHVDVWTPDADSLLVRLVDFGGDGFGNGNDTQGDVTFDSGTTPALAQGMWVSLDIPLADFQAAGLANLTDINQLVFDPTPDGTALYIDNVYFYDDGSGGGTAPTTSAPTPTQNQADVISLYSDSYTDPAVTWPTPWSVPNDMVSDVTIDGGLVKEHLNTSFIGVEFASIDASGMTHFHMDVWTPDADSLLLKLVDFGGDGFGGGNDSEGPLTFDAGSTPALTQGGWVSLDIPLADMQAAGLANLSDINQLVFDPAADGTAVYVDNVYFYNDSPGGGTAPTTSAPTPAQAQADVMSLYSDAYTDAAVTWPTPWSVPNDMVSDVTIDGGLVKEHLNTSFIGVEFPSMDVSGMTHFHMDVWTPDADSLLLKLVDFGGDGFGGGNDSEGPLTFDAGSTPALTQGGWVSLDIPLSDMQAAGLANLSDINQLVFDPAADGTAVYVDNVYFYSDTGGSGGGTGAATGELVLNGDFEDGLNGWVIFDSSNSGQGGTISAGAPNSSLSSGANSARIYSVGPSQFPLLKLERLSEGVLANGASVTVSFDWYNPVQTVDSTVGPIVGNNVVIVQLLTELTGDNGATTEDLIAPPTFLTAGPNWQSESFTTVLGADAGGGVSLFFQTNTGGNANAEMDLYIDNVSVFIN